MIIQDKKGGDFTPHPETDGPVKAVIVDATPLKKMQSEFGEREVFRLVYETEVTNDEGVRQCVWSRPYTPSINPKSNMAKDLKKILGRDLTAEERAEGFDTECLIGKGVKLIVQHEEGKDDKTYAVISFIAPDKEKPVKPSGKYVRVQDREEKKDGAEGSSASFRKAPKADEDEGRTPWQKCKVHVGAHAGLDLGDLDKDAVRKLIDNWLPKAKAQEKPKADDKRLMAALTEVAGLPIWGAKAEEPEPEY